MTIWTPELGDAKPRYRALADAIAKDLRQGRLKPGDKLPTHRDLADALGVTVGTITRGYAEAERRGLTTGEVGRGTYLRRSPVVDPWPEAAEAEDVIDLSLSLPVSLPEESDYLADTLRLLADDPHLGQLLHYHPETAAHEHRAAASSWLSRLGLSPDVPDVLLTAGSQHALNVVWSSLFHAGQVIATEELTYPSVKTQAHAYGIRLRGITMDDEGMCPEALARACRMEPKPTAVYVVPTIQNPTSAIMSSARRQAIIDVAQEYGLWIIEDDVHGFLLEEPIRPMAAMAPDKTVYLSSLAKCLAPGLRIGFVVTPKALRSRLLTGIHNTQWMPAPLMAAAASHWITSGIADELMAAKRKESARRQRLASNILAEWQPKAHPFGYQLWLELPEPWFTESFVAKARERKLVILGAGAFAVNRRQVPQAVRISIGTPSYTDLEHALPELAALLKEPGTSSY